MRGAVRWLMVALVVLVPFLGAAAARAQRVTAELTGPVEGLSGSCPELRFRVAGREVRTHAGTEFDDGRCAALVNGLRVEVEGVVQSDGTLLASEVDLD